MAGAGVRAGSREGESSNTHQGHCGKCLDAQTSMCIREGPRTWGEQNSPAKTTEELAAFYTLVSWNQVTHPLAH